MVLKNIQIILILICIDFHSSTLVPVGQIFYINCHPDFESALAVKAVWYASNGDTVWVGRDFPMHLPNSIPLAIKALEQNGIKELTCISYNYKNHPIQNTFHSIEPIMRTRNILLLDTHAVPKDYYDSLDYVELGEKTFVDINPFSKNIKDIDELDQIVSGVKNQGNSYMSETICKYGYEAEKYLCHLCKTGFAARAPYSMNSCKPCPLNTYRSDNLEPKLGCFNCPFSQVTKQFASTHVKNCTSYRYGLGRFFQNFLENLNSEMIAIVLFPMEENKGMKLTNLTIFVIALLSVETILAIILIYRIMLIYKAKKVFSVKKNLYRKFINGQKNCLEKLVEIKSLLAKVEMHEIKNTFGIPKSDRL